MNIQKIFEALADDEMNSSLGILCAELERQGYEIEIEEIKVTAEEIFENKLTSLEEITEPLSIKIYKDGQMEQKFAIEFIDYHKIKITEAPSIS